MNAQRLSIRAPAKVNLFLRVLGRRPDGYHEVATCLHALELHDELAVQPADAPGVALVLAGEAASGLPVTADADNLVCRAARLFERRTGVRLAVRFELCKRIPAGGGLGGGSSDAAAALKLLDAMHGNPLGLDALESVAAELGADVPFFVRGGTQLGTGRGDRLETIDSPPCLHFALICPPFGTETAAVYKKHAATLTGASYQRNFSFDKALARQELAVPGSFVNDLEGAAMTLQPELGTLFRDARGRGHEHVRLSGSGSTLFVAVGDAASATRACRDLATLATREHGACEIVQTRSDRPPTGGHAPIAGQVSGGTRRASDERRRER